MYLSPSLSWKLSPLNSTFLILSRLSVFFQEAFSGCSSPQEQIFFKWQPPLPVPIIGHLCHLSYCYLISFVPYLVPLFRKQTFEKVISWYPCTLWKLSVYGLLPTQKDTTLIILGTTKWMIYICDLVIDMFCHQLCAF